RAGGVSPLMLWLMLWFGLSLISLSFFNFIRGLTPPARHSRGFRARVDPGDDRADCDRLAFLHENLQHARDGCRDLLRRLVGAQFVERFIDLDERPVGLQPAVARPLAHRLAGPRN